MTGPAPVVPNYDDVWNAAYGEMQDRGPVHLHMRRMLGRLLGRLDYESVLDVGCGAGHNLPVVCAGRSLRRVTGVDISEEALGRARDRSPAEFQRLDIEAGALPGTWDLVFSSLVLEHVPDDRAALRHMRAMCGRHLVVTTIAGDFERYRPWEEQMGHVRNYARGELEEKLGEAGFRVRETIYWGRPFYTPLARTLQNRMTSEPEFTPATRAIAWTMHKLYYLNSARRGDLLIARADVA
jgi:SAM-dependent methyltransferase